MHAPCKHFFAFLRFNDLPRRDLDLRSCCFSPGPNLKRKRRLGRELHKSSINLSFKKEISSNLTPLTATQTLSSSLGPTSIIRPTNRLHDFSFIKTRDPRTSLMRMLRNCLFNISTMKERRRKRRKRSG